MRVSGLGSVTQRDCEVFGLGTDDIGDKIGWDGSIESVMMHFYRSFLVCRLLFALVYRTIMSIWRCYGGLWQSSSPHLPCSSK
jgi:hypothetical protein